MKAITIVIIALTCISNVAISQVWKKQPADKNTDSVYAIYEWDASNQYHAAFGQITLLKNGWFLYRSERPLGFNEFSEGAYTIKKNILTLVSDLQIDNVKVKIDYIDTVATDTLYRKLSFPQNSMGHPMYYSSYVLNYDTTWKGIYFPGSMQVLPSTIFSLKVKFASDFASSWLPVENNNKYIKVTALTDKNFDNYAPKIIKQWAFKINESGLTEIKKDVINCCY